MKGSDGNPVPDVSQVVALGAVDDDAEDRVVAEEEVDDRRPS